MFPNFPKNDKDTLYWTNFNQKKKCKNKVHCAVTIMVHRLVYCGAVSQTKVSADTMCLQKATDKSWVLFRTFQKNEKKRLYWAYSQLKAASWLWHFSPNLCRQFLSEVRGLLCTVALDLKNLPWNCVKVTWYCYTYNFCILRKCK